MRKFAVLVLAIVSFVFCASPGAADDIEHIEKWETLNKSVMSLADKIAAHNKPEFETQLTKKERSYDDDLYGRGLTSAVWLRVWAKDKTIVSGWAKANKKFEANSISTIDPNLTFVGGIRVGNNVKVLESFFRASLREINGTDKVGVVHGSSHSDLSDGWYVCVSHKDGVITEIHAFRGAWSNGPVPLFLDRFLTFSKKMRRQLGFPISVSPYEKDAFLSVLFDSAN